MRTRVRPYLVLSVLLSAALAACTQSAAAKTLIPIETEGFALVYQGEEGQTLKQVYCGQKLSNAAEYQLLRTRHNAFVSAGVDDLFEPAIRMIHADNNPSLKLVYEGHHTSEEDDSVLTVITLKDPIYPVTVKLHVKAYRKLDLLKTWTEITHREDAPVLLDRFASGLLHLNAESYWLTQFHGDWAQEMRMEEKQLTHGLLSIESKLGTRATKYQAPFFFLSLERPANETSGHVIAGTIAWSGNFQLAFEIDQRNFLRVLAGMNPYASQYTLHPEESFLTPAFIFTFSADGKGQASRNLHQWARKYGIVDGEKDRLTLLNNWEATSFNFNQNKLVRLFDGAVKLGVDLFLLDDGWFGNRHPRNSARAGLGDWQVNRRKLPDGLGYLIEQADAKGLKFGIWIEPEMVNPKSELYERHPEWILKLPNREEHYERNQLVLDLANPEVQQYIFSVVDELITKHPSIAYIKWDCNRTLTYTYSPYLKSNPSHVFIKYTRGLYTVLNRLREKNPHLPIMLCAGGGGRTDYGAMKYCTEFWPSDNTDAFDRIFIQWGYSCFFPANTICNHVTTMGSQSLKFRTDVAMMGKLGYDIRVDRMSEMDLAFSRQSVEHYNRLKEIIWSGDLYRLVSPYERDQAALMYVKPGKSRSVLFAYTLYPLHRKGFCPVRLAGLDPEKMYTIREVNLFPKTASKLPENGKVISGDYLMKVGLNLPLNGRLASLVIEINEWQ